MCQRKENEPWYSYAFRMSCEQPRGVLSVLGLAVAGLAIFALGYIYVDSSKRAERQTEAYLEVAQLIRDMDVRMQAMDAHLRQLDIWHKKEFMGE